MNALPKSRITRYEDFWPFYLSQHSQRWTRRFHIVGLLLAITFTVGCVIRSQLHWIPLALVLGYGPAWFSHFFIERNRPATFGHPLWSFISDFRMAYLTLTGRL